ncbi:hypothetical protein [Actinomadura sp. WMMB 499]|uniref:hypothetical protein n=1 Tax=Actinomadura sp. WMMB 499 TaxID=1219491 RepID=UPI0012482824|nr:hypothetical protein [Actinomadura sp. WMMB 499]QFG22082.1 hypothetical protein F7P10_14060 [Actinomadura sp. WMMB 499]
MGQKSEIDKDEVRAILRVLRNNLATFESGSGTRNDISMNANITNSELGQYPAVSALNASSQSAYGQIKGQYDGFLNSYQGIIDALDRIVGNHEETDQGNAANANQVNANLNNTSAY